jgi:hypothetical protein
MRRQAARLAAVGALVACTVLAVGCGGQREVTDAAYGKQLRAATSGLDGVSGAISEATQPSKVSVAERVAQVRSIQLGLRESGNELADVTPPDDLRDDHDQLVQGVRDMADAIDLLIQAEELSVTNPQRATTLLRQFATDPSLARVQEAATNITKAGVDAGL